MKKLIPLAFAAATLVLFSQAACAAPGDKKFSITGSFKGDKIQPDSSVYIACRVVRSNNDPTSALSQMNAAQPIKVAANGTASGNWTVDMTVSASVLNGPLAWNCYSAYMPPNYNGLPINLTNGLTPLVKGEFK